MLPQTVFLFLSVLISFLIFLRFESDNLKPLKIAFTLSDVIGVAVLFVSKVMYFYAFSIVFISCSPFLFIFLVCKFFSFLGGLARASLRKWKARKELIFSMRNVKGSGVDFEFSCFVKWDFFNYLFFISFCIVLVLYKGIFVGEVTVYDYLTILFLLLMFFLLLVLHFGFEKVKSSFFIITFLSFVCGFVAPYLTLDLFSRYSDVSPEKVIRLLTYINITSFAFVFCTLLSLFYSFFMMMFVFCKVYYYLFTKFSLFKDDCKINILRPFFGRQWFEILIFLAAGVGIPIVLSMSYFASPNFRFEQAISTIFFSENNERCATLGKTEKIYFYEVGRVIKYVPGIKNGVKYRDVDCKSNWLFFVNP